MCVAWIAPRVRDRTTIVRLETRRNASDVKNCGPRAPRVRRARTPRAPRPSRRARRTSSRPLVVRASPAGARVERRSGARAERRTGREKRKRRRGPPRRAMSRLSCDGDQPRTRFTRAARVARASPVAPRAPRPRSARSGDRREDERRPATTGDEEEEERTTAARDVPAELRQ